MQCAAVTRPDWLRNAAGLRQLEYWTGKLEPRPTVDWYDVAKAGQRKQEMLS